MEKEAEIGEQGAGGGGEKEGERGTKAGSADEETVASKYQRVGA